MIAFFYLVSLGSALVIGDYPLTLNLTDYSATNNPLLANVEPEGYLADDMGIDLDSPQRLYNNPHVNYVNLPDIQISFQFYPFINGEYHIFCIGYSYPLCDLQIRAVLGATDTNDTIAVYRNADLLSVARGDIPTEIPTRVNVSMVASTGYVNISFTGYLSIVQVQTDLGYATSPAPVSMFISTDDSPRFGMANLLIITTDSPTPASASTAGDSAWMSWGVPLIVFGCIALAIWKCGRYPYD